MDKRTKMYRKNNYKKHGGNFERVILLAIFNLCVLTNLLAQDSMSKDSSTTFGIAIKSKSNGKSVVLRWAPTDGVAWSLSRRKGYILYRINYHLNGTTDTILLTQKPVMPLPLDELNKQAGKNNKYVAMAAQALYGKDFKLTDKAPSSFLEEIQQQTDAYNLRFFVAMQAADLSPDAATALGLRWIDSNVEEGMFYGYIVRSDTSAAGFTVKPGITKLVVGPADTILPQGLEGISADRQIELHWSREQMGGYTYFFVERSDDGGKTYKRLTDEPYFSSYDPMQETSEDSLAARSAAILKFSQVFIDSIPANYVNFSYRIAGIDPFGDISPYSVPITIHGIDKTPPSAVIIDSVINIFQNHVLIKWNDREKAPDLAGYFVARGNNVSGPFFPLHEKLLAVKTNHYLDTTASANDKIYYIVASIDTAGNYTYSIPRMGILTDTIPPERPTGLIGIMDKSGLTGLQWNLNKEQDVKGYKVYSSYDPVIGFIQITNYPVEVNTFIDSISPRSLNRSIYYKIVAIDRNGNHSDYSELIKVDKPEPVAPTIPVAKNIYIQNEKIITEWIGTREDGIAGYEIFRRTKEDSSWILAGKVTAIAHQSDFVFSDSSIKPNKDYIYAAEALDITGVRSERSFAVTIRNSKNEILETPKSLKAVFSKKEKAVTITWIYPGMEEDYFYIIYRAEGEGPLRMWESKGKGDSSAVDYHIKNGLTYRYAIEVRQRNSNLRSERSKEVKVVIEN